MGKNILVNSSVDETYKNLSSKSGYNPTDGTYTNKAKSALTSYISERGYKGSVSSYSSNTWSNFTSDIGKNRPILLFVDGIDRDGQTTIGHYVVVVGYATSTNNAQYLAVYTGWTNYATYVKFKPDCLDTFWGYGVSISK